MSKGPATYQDILDAPPNQLAEIVGGELRLSPNLPAPHACVLSVLNWTLGVPFDKGHGGPGGWIFLFKPELHLGSDVLVPDLAAWQRERLPQLPEEHIDIAPNWVCEVLSKPTEHIDRLEKLPCYAAAGVEHAWLVSPRMRSIETYRLVDGAWIVSQSYREATRARVAPFDAVELDLGTLWADLPRPKPTSPHDCW